MGQAHRPLCDAGNNSFEAASHTELEVTVTVGPETHGAFAQRACKAELSWNTQKLIVSAGAAEIDLDVFGADLKGAGPVAAFQVKQSPGTCCMAYQIYSLNEQPHLLRAIQGGFFHAADTDLDGRVEIWAEDAAAVDGLDGLSVTAFDSLPTYVLRWEDNRLLDATRQFAVHFDQVIDGIRAQLDQEMLRDFKSSDGKLAFSAAGIEQLHKLRVIKVRVLEIVWAYLYSGREDEAWRSLKEMWPAQDLDRIHSAIVHARNNGLLAQIDGAASDAGTRKRVRIFKQRQVKPARVIQLWRSDLQHQKLPSDEVLLDLVIDSAGKVRSAKPAWGETEADQGLLSFAKEWKFIPARRNGHSVASRLRLGVVLKL